MAIYSGKYNQDKDFTEAEKLQGFIGKKVIELLPVIDGRTPIDIELDNTTDIYGCGGCSCLVNSIGWSFADFTIKAISQYTVWNAKHLKVIAG